MLCRLGFLLALVLCAAFFFSQGTNINIDTDIKNLSPQWSQEKTLAKAVEQLSRQMDAKVILLVEGESATTVSAATEKLNTHLASLKLLAKLDRENLDTVLVDGLQAYRFQLLSESQAKALQAADKNQLLAQSYQKLYQLGGEYRLIPFDQDPAGWFSEALLEQLNTLSLADKREVQSSEQDPSSFFALLTLELNQQALTIDAQKKLQQDFQTIEQQIEAEYPVAISHSGTFFFAAEAATEAQKDIQWISTLSSVGVVLLLLLAFRQLSPLLLAISAIAIGLLSAFAVSHWLFNGVHIITLVFGAGLVGIIVDYALHFFYHHIFQAEENTPSKNKLYTALSLSLLSSLIGYGALGLSGLDALKKVAVFSCIGLLISWCSIIAMGSYLAKNKGQGANNAFNQGLHKLYQGLYIPKAALTACVLLLLLSFAGLLFTKQIAFSDDPRLFFKQSEQRLQEEQSIRQKISDYEAGRYLLITGTSPEAIYQSLADFSEVLAEHHIDASDFYSLTTLLPSPQQQERNYQLQEKFYGESGAVIDLFQQLNMAPEKSQALIDAYQEAQGKSLTPQQLLEALPNLPPLWLQQDQRIYNFILLPPSVDHQSLQQLAEQQPQVSYLSLVEQAEQSLRQQRQGALYFLAIALAIIGGVLAIYYRNLAALAMISVPLVSMIATLLILSLSGQAITLFHIMALFLVLGLGMDYVIFASSMGASKMLTSASILLSALTSLLSFGLLSVSTIPVVQAFGVSVLIGNTINLIGALNYGALMGGRVSNAGRH